MSDGHQDSKPFWQKTLDDYPDDIIVRTRASGRGWYAVLDSGFDSSPGDPDFSTFGETREQAVANAARIIRADAQGIGKFAPHSILVQPYSLHFQLCKHWELKQRAVAIGMDPHEFMDKAMQDGERWLWHLEGSWLNQTKAHPKLEAFAMIVLGEMEPLILSGEDPEIGAIEARSKFSILVRDEVRGVRTTEKTTEEFERRIQERIANIAAETNSRMR